MMMWGVSGVIVSHSTRSAWIETLLPKIQKPLNHVALHKECVD